MDRSYDAENDISIIDNTVYISGTKIGRTSDWHDDRVKVPSLWNAVPMVSQYKSFTFGMKVIPYKGDLASPADKVVPYFSTDPKIVPLLAVKYTDVATALDDSLGTVPMGLNSCSTQSQRRQHYCKK